MRAPGTTDHGAEARGGFIEQALCFEIAGRKVRPPPSRSANSRSPMRAQASGTVQDFERSARGPSLRDRGVFHVPQQILSFRHDRNVAGLVGQCESPRYCGACVFDVLLASTSSRPIQKRSRFDDRRESRQIQNLFVPPHAFGRMATNHPEEHQAPRKVDRFGGAVAFDEPRQSNTVTLEIVTHAM